MCASDAIAATGAQTRLVLQIHDELLFEGPPGEMEETTELVRREMCAAYQLDPPLEVDIGVGRGLARGEVRCTWIRAWPSCSPPSPAA